MEILAACLAGAAAGALHTFTGPDHMAAVAFFSAERKDASGRTGFIWGLGHTAGAVMVGLLALALREIFHADVFSSVTERLVGLALTGAGGWGLWRAIAWRIHEHGHHHGGQWHAHHHIHEPETIHVHDERSGDPHASHLHAAFGVGALSGLAGGSHILAVSPALAMPSTLLAAAYLGAFAAGSIASMTLFSMTAGAVTARMPAGAERGFTGAISAAALLVGVAWLAW